MDQSGCFAQTLVVSALLGQVGEAFGQVGAGVAQPSGFVGVAEQGLREGEGDQIGVGQAGLETDRGSPGGQVRAVFQKSLGDVVECLGEGVQVLRHNSTMDSLVSCSGHAPLGITHLGHVGVCGGRCLFGTHVPTGTHERRGDRE